MNLLTLIVSALVDAAFLLPPTDTDFYRPEDTLHLRFPPLDMWEYTVRKKDDHAHA